MGNSAAVPLRRQRAVGAMQHNARATPDMMVIPIPEGIQKREPHSHDHDHDWNRNGKVVVTGSNDKVRVHRRHSHSHDGHEHNRNGKVVVTGSNDKVNVHHRRHSHHHHGNNNGKVVVTGSNDKVRVHRRHSHDHHRYNNGKVVVTGSNDKVDVDGNHYSRRSLVIADTIKDYKYIVAHSHYTQPQPLLGMEVNVKRDGAEMEGTPGRVDLVNTGSGSNSTISTLGSLLLGYTNSTSSPTGSNSTDSPMVLNASQANSTTIYLVPLPSSSAPPNWSSNSTNGTDTLITLQMAVFDPSSAQQVANCATFDSSSSTPEPLTAQPCFATASSEFDAWEQNSGQTSGQSQIFVYEQSSGAVRPMWMQDGNTTSTNNTSSPPPTPTGSERRDEQAEGVSLIFVPADPSAVQNYAQDGASTSVTFSSTSSVLPTPTMANPSQATSTDTNMASGTTSMMQDNAASAASVVSVTATSTPPSMPTPSSSAASTTPSAQALGVEVIGVSATLDSSSTPPMSTNSVATSASSTSMSAVPTSTSTSSPTAMTSSSTPVTPPSAPSPSAPISADSIASSIAAAVESVMPDAPRS